MACFVLLMGLEPVVDGAHLRLITCDHIMEHVLGLSES